MEMEKSLNYIIKLIDPAIATRLGVNGNHYYMGKDNRAVWEHEWTFRGRDVRCLYPRGIVKMKKFSGCPGCGSPFRESIKTEGHWGLPDWKWACLDCGDVTHPEKWHGPIGWKWNG